MDSQLVDQDLVLILKEMVPFLIALLVVIVAALSRDFRDILIETSNIAYKFMELFFYRRETSSVKSSEIEALRKKVKELSEKLNTDVLRENKDSINLEIDNYINNNLGDILNNRLNESDAVENAVIRSLKTDVVEETTKYLESLSPKTLQAALSDKMDSDRKSNSHINMLETLEREANSASMLKMVMINLFVIATVAFLVFNIAIRPDLTTDAYIATVALYLSLGAFMLYIIRTSHFRSSVLLAIREQSSNYYNALDYLEKIKSGGEINEHDVEIVRMLLVNRSEREHRADHPYEVILKGISGSNIQFKGGKMSLGNSKEK